MPNIPKFEGGDLRFTPSDKGSAAFRELGGVEAHMAAIQHQAWASAGRALGEGIDNIVSKAQAHNDALAEIQFNHEMTAGEVAAIGGVDLAGSPKDQDGAPITETPGRGNYQSIPDTASVPSPDQFASAASATIESHNNFLDGLVERFSGLGTSQRARDRMAVAAAKSADRLSIKAHAQAGEVAFTYATTATERSLKMAVGAVSRGGSLSDAIPQIDGAFDALRGTLSGDFAVKGAKWIEQKQNNAYNAAIQSAIQYQLKQNHPEAARSILNDPKWDKYIGDQRDKIENNIAQFQSAQARAQESQIRLQQTQQKQAGLARADQYIQEVAKGNPKVNFGDVWTDPQFKDRPDLRGQASELFIRYINAMSRDLNVSPQLSATTRNDLFKRMHAEDGDPNKITDMSPINQAFIDGKLLQKDYDWLNARFKESSAPAVKQFNTGVKKWLDDGGKGQIDRRFAISGGMEHTQLGQQKINEWNVEVNRRAQIMRSQGKDPNALLDPNSPDSMVSPKALAPYRVTPQMEQAYKRQQQAIDQQTQSQSAAGQTPTGTLPVPDSLRSSPQGTIYRNGNTFYNSQTKKFYDWKGNETAPPPPQAKAPAKPTQQPAATPTPQKINYAPEQQSSGNAASQAINQQLEHGAEGNINTNAQTEHAAFPEHQAKLEAAQAPQGMVRAVTDQTERLRNVRGYGQQLTGAININGHSYHFINGGGGRGSIPFGTYTVSNFRTAEQRERQGLINLGDTFDLSDVKDPYAGSRPRQDLRIHAAHGRGTLGCIGILGGPKKFEEFARDMKAAGITKLTLGPQGIQTAAQ